ncbi:hypothetical protein C8D92_102233 [Tamilnaduibacter salinus]|uniref:Uncharacterized protein n=1 Tax=Tamilnaduibacter salinus TaxID=1484056 RepID=A0A2U1CZJ5_9GAMM|nr:hypothetical protein [Tamilnaduibacter salinus]PVY78193.1 hypothetical protein C8D92_102233 [Tamilnaduibacter salinus]
MSGKPYGYLQEAMESLESWSLEEAIEIGEECVRSGVCDDSPAHQWSVWKNWLPPLEKRWQEGDSKALFEALSMCGEQGLPMPPWCVDAVQDASSKIKSFEVRNWNEIFAAPHKGRRIHDLKREANIKPPAIRQVLSLRERENPVPVMEALSHVAGEYAVSMEKLREWYYEYLKTFPITTLITDAGRIQIKTGSRLPDCGDIHGTLRHSE